MSKRFGVLEEQAAKDREVLTGLVSQVKQQSQGQGQKRVTNLLSSESVPNSSKYTCQINVTKQCHKSDSKTHLTLSNQNKVSQSDMHRDSLFPRDNTTINTHSNTGNGTTLNGAGVISPEQVTRCQIYDGSQSTAHQFFNPSYQMQQQTNTMVTPT